MDRHGSRQLRQAISTTAQLMLVVSLDVVNVVEQFLDYCISVDLVVFLLALGDNDLVALDRPLDASAL